MSVANINTKWRKSNTEKTLARSYPLVKVPYGTANYQCRMYENYIAIKQILISRRKTSPPIRTKGDITELSYKSKLNSIKVLSSIQTRFLHQPTFVTFTYHNEWPATHQELKHDLDIFIKRLRRRWPKLHYFYSIELQKRGTPHFHFLFFQPLNQKRVPVRILVINLASIWNKINRCGCSDCTRYSTHLRDVDNIKRATRYLTKYMTKQIDQKIQFSAGRRWNKSKNLPTAPYYTIDLDHATEDHLKKIVLNHLIMGSDSAFRYATKILEPGTYFLLVDIELATKWISEVLQITIPPPT